MLRRTKIEFATLLSLIYFVCLFFLVSNRYYLNYPWKTPTPQIIIEKSTETEKKNFQQPKNEYSLYFLLENHVNGTELAVSSLVKTSRKALLRECPLREHSLSYPTKVLPLSRLSNLFLLSPSLSIFSPQNSTQKTLSLHTPSTFSFEESVSTSSLRVFFIWTSNTASKSGFDCRNRRSLESVFYHNPEATVYIFSNVLPPDIIEPFRLRGYKIHLVPLNLIQLVGGDLPEVLGWYEKESKWKKSPYYYSHFTDLIRMILLYRFGGIYLDMDVIVLKDLKTIPPNSIGIQRYSFTGDALNGAIMKFEKKQSTFIRSCISDFVGKYNPDDWAWNGPALLTRVYKHYWKKYNYQSHVKNQNQEVSSLNEIEKKIISRDDINSKSDYNDQTLEQNTNNNEKTEKKTEKEKKIITYPEELIVSKVINPKFSLFSSKLKKSQTKTLKNQELEEKEEEEEEVIVQVVNKDGFYPVIVDERMKCFNGFDEVLEKKIEKKSFAFHLSGKVSSELKIHLGSVCHNILNLFCIFCNDDCM